MTVENTNCKLRVTRNKIKLTVLPTNILFPCIDSTKNKSDIFEKHNNTNIFLIGNSNMMGVRHSIDRGIKSLISKELPHENFINFGIPYSDILNFYNIIQSHVPYNSRIIIELNSNIILKHTVTFDENDPFETLTEQTFTSVFISLLELLRKKHIACIFTTTEAYKNRNLESKFFKVTKYLNSFITTDDDCDSDIHHLSYFGNKRYSKFISNLILTNRFISNYDLIINDLKNQITCDYRNLFRDQYTKRNKNNFNILKISNQYFDYIKYLQTIAKRDNNIKYKALICGSFNPITVGHEYLIKFAADQNDKVYIITTESDNLFFSFNDRKQMILDVIQKYNNVELLNSYNIIGNEIITNDYIFKNVDDLNNLDFTLDNSLIVDTIMSILKVKKRYFGKEPDDNVTDIYLEKFKIYANTKNIKCCIIDRICCENNTPISGTLIREYYKTNNFKKLKKIIPNEIYNYLLKLKK